MTNRAHQRICNECNQIYKGSKSSICPNCWSHDTIDLKTAQEEFDYAKFQGDVDYDPNAMNVDLESEGLE